MTREILKLRQQLLLALTLARNFKKITAVSQLIVGFKKFANLSIKRQVQKIS